MKNLSLILSEMFSLSIVPRIYKIESEDSKKPYVKRYIEITRVTDSASKIPSHEQRSLTFLGKKLVQAIKWTLCKNMDSREIAQLLEFPDEGEYTKDSKVYLDLLIEDGLASRVKASGPYILSEEGKELKKKILEKSSKAFTKKELGE